MSDEDTIARALLMQAANQNAHVVRNGVRVPNPSYDPLERLVCRERLTGALLARKGRPVTLPDGVVVALNRDLDGPAWLSMTGYEARYSRKALEASCDACEARWGAGCWGGWPEGGAA